MSIWEYGYNSVFMQACIACFKFNVISVDFKSPRGLLLRSLVLNVAILYWQLTNAASWPALERPLLICEEYHYILWSIKKN